MPLTFDRPSDVIMREFQAVSRRAASLEQALTAKTNRPLDTLPRLQLQEILSVLKALPDSTAEGGRLQLEMADARLNEIRFEYFSLSGNEDDPGFMRDVPLDDTFSLLIAAARTALTAANREASIRDLGIPRTDSYDQEAGANEIAGALDQGDDAILELSKARKVGRSILLANSSAGDTLLRRLNDATGLSRQARVELQWKELVTAWIRKLAAALSRTPELLRISADAIDATRDIAGPFYDQWKEFNEDVESIARKNLPIFTENLRKAADRLDGKRHPERILLVDDEESVRAFSETALMDAGWSVQSAGSAKEALELAIRTPFDLLVTDVVMPDMDGVALSHELRKINRKLKILLISGYAEDSVLRDVEQRGWQFLPKPYSLKQLQDAVEYAVGRKRAS